MAEISRPLTERLIACKYILRQARATLSSDAPFAAGLAISHAQDAVELFLRVLADHFHASLKERASFDQLVDAVEESLPANLSLTHKPALAQLNKARVNFKHFALEPKRDDAEKLLSDAESFVPATYFHCFGAEYSSLSIFGLLGYRRSENWLKKAELEVEAGDYQDAIDCAAAALALYRHHLGLESRRVRLDRFGNLRKRGLDDLADAVTDELEEIHSELELVFAGANMQQYLAFRRFARYVTMTMGGTLHFGAHPWGEVKPSKEHALACLSFAVDTALALKRASVPGHFERRRPVASRRLEAVSQGEIVVHPSDHPEVIRSVEPGEILSAPSGRRKDEYETVIQDDEFACILATCVREVSSDAT